MRLSEAALIDDDATTPAQALRLAYDGVRQLSIQGSCTALLGVLRRDTLLLTDFDDSGAMLLSVTTPTPDGDGFAALDRGSIVKGKLVDSDDDDERGVTTTPRGYEIVFKTEEQQHRFNCPYQLGLESSDAPESGTVSAHAVKVGDLVIAGSDGLWDNLFCSTATSGAWPTSPTTSPSWRSSSGRPRADARRRCEAPGRPRSPSTPPRPGSCSKAARWTTSP